MKNAFKDKIRKAMSALIRNGKTAAWVGAASECRREPRNVANLLSQAGTVHLRDLSLADKTTSACGPCENDPYDDNLLRKYSKIFRASTTRNSRI